MRNLMLLLLLASALPACKSKESIPLTDPATGKVIGHKDATTGALVFNDGTQVARSRIENVVDTVRARNLFSQATNMLQAKPTFLPMPTGSSGGGCGGCTGSCWRMAEGGAMCTGCCVSAGKCACTCWESCSDRSSSSTGTPY